MKPKKKNVKTQLLSIVCGKDEDEQYKYKQNEPLEMISRKQDSMQPKQLLVHP